mmetsp:Transcript_43202/g.113472  ORF Transcript_43202/g.113472 Transcript_43202/m.113472 type:complete len:259 (+) Transcript_43202:996-1772(+)
MMQPRETCDGTPSISSSRPLYTATSGSWPKPSGATACADPEWMKKTELRISPFCTICVPASAVRHLPWCRSAKNCCGDTPYGANCLWYMAISSSSKKTDFLSVMKSSGHMPSRQPIEMPIALAEPLMKRTCERASCSGARGGVVMNFAVHASIISPKLMPTTSEMRLPNPAAANVERPNLTPRVASIRSPTRIMMALSANPKPMKGTPPASASVSSCLLVGLGTRVPRSELLHIRRCRPQASRPRLRVREGWRSIAVR